MPPSTTAAAAQAFVEKWERVTLNERAVAQSHFNDLCHLLGQQGPIEADPDGTYYRFEKPLTKVGGKAGFADVWRKDRYAFEYKTRGRYIDLRQAYQQLLLYKEDLDNPPILAATDVENFEIHVAFTGFKTRVERFTNADIRTVGTRELLHLVLTDPEQLRPAERAESVTEEAAARFATVAQLLERRGFAPSRIAPFFMKLVFAFFVEDLRLLPGNLMTQHLEASIFAPQEFPDRMRALFQTLNTGGYFGLARVPRFNGGLFANDDVLPLTADEIQYLAAAARLDWREVEPAVFGTLFERSIDPAKRAQLGLHYTSTADIRLIVEPVLMDPLRREWVEVRSEAESVRPQWETASGTAKQRLQNRMEGGLFDFADRLAHIKVLDPAAGSGNFLYVALKSLKDLEKEVLVYANGVGLTPPELGVSPAQLYGIEKDPFAAELAQVVVWIGYLQWLYTNGLPPPPEPILQTLDTIQCRDAILEIDDQGRPVEPEWPAADVIVGNPPFLGDKRMRAELSDPYVEHLRGLYSGRVPGGADLVTYWFERARSAIANGKTKRVGLLSTNSIRYGENRRVMERIKQSGDIFMAWRDRQWVLNGAAVRVSMVGFDNGSESVRTLDDVSVTQINPDLTARIDVTAARTLQENQGVVFLGMMKAGPFDLSAEVAETLLGVPKNANGRYNCDVVKRRLGGQDVTGRPRNGWVIDFGVDTTEDAAACYESPFAHVLTHVKPLRDQNRRAGMRRKWWIHGEPRRALRQALHGLSQCIVTPEVAKHRVFTWMSTATVPDHTLHVFARDDDYFFGMLHSRIHEVWSLAQCNFMGMGNDPRYNSSRTFGTFPLPWAPGDECQDDPLVEAIAVAARGLVTVRDAWLAGAAYPELPTEKRTLTNLYNARPDWLDEAHRQLDAAVLHAYGWPRDLSDEEILARLLALNLERAAGQNTIVVRREEALVDAE
jgi:hypothetical protein